LQELSWAHDGLTGLFYGTVGGPSRSLPTDGYISVRAGAPKLFVFGVKYGEPVTLTGVDPRSGSSEVLLELTPPATRFGIVGSADGRFAYFNLSSEKVDEGIQRLDLTDGTVTEITAPAPLPTFPPTGPPTGRGGLLLSPDEGTLVAVLCDTGRCAIDVVDTATLAVRRIEDRDPLAVGDETILLRIREDTRLLLRTIANDEERTIEPWDRSDAFPAGAQILGAVALGDNGYVLGRSGFRHYDITLVDAAAGTETLLWRDPDPGERRALDLITSLPPIGDWVWLSGPDGPAPGEALWGLNARNGTLLEVGAFAPEAGS